MRLGTINWKRMKHLDFFLEEQLSCKLIQNSQEFTATKIVLEQTIFFSTRLSTQNH